MAIERRSLTVFNGKFRKEKIVTDELQPGAVERLKGLVRGGNLKVLTSDSILVTQGRGKRQRSVLFQGQEINNACILSPRVPMNLMRRFRAYAWRPTDKVDHKKVES